jgi:hypothetical protein
MAHKKPILRTLAVTATVLSIAATPAWAAWTYIGPGARSVHLTLPSVMQGPVITNAVLPLPVTTPPPRKGVSLTNLQRQGRLSGVLAHDLHGWEPNRWVPAGHGPLRAAIERLLPRHAIHVHTGLLLPTVSWPSGTASVALYHVARSAGLLLVVTHHDVYVLAG